MVIKQETTLFPTIERETYLEEERDKLFTLLYENNMLCEFHLLGTRKSSDSEEMPSIKVLYSEREDITNLSLKTKALPKK